ncbi:metal-dependent hydrolase family protein [Phenylobacterium sp.]|jgi:imidazolonepropionase-like amidohydrolase|uniref:metal-dependent hydrolase family protein n=1 Tax=Phenylobacterium sp. TaxID=1871053 RepID=UPI0039C91F92
MKRLLAGALMAAAFALPAAAQQTQTTFVQAGRVLADPATGRVETAKTLVVQNGKVARIVDGYVAEPGGRVVDLKDSFVLPGFIDSHVHITSEQNPNARLQEVTETSADQAMMGVRFARRTLLAGFTTVADLGADNEAIFALKRAIAAGDVAGPRILASGSAISVHGGHGDVNGYREDVMHVLRPGSVCSGAADCSRAVREQVWKGADLIKITATGGVLSNTAAGLAQQFNQAELDAIVESAHRMGRRVTAHAHGADGIVSFLKAGGDSIEHGTYLDAEGIALLKKNNGYLVPTLMAGDFVARVAAGPNNFLTPAQSAKALEAGPKMLDMARRAHQGGVKIAFGTDNGVAKHGDNAYEFVLLSRAGLTPLQAIQTATVNAADHLQLNGVAGKLTPGHSADIVAVKGDPLRDVSVLQSVGFVMKEGVVHKGP